MIIIVTSVTAELNFALFYFSTLILLYKLCKIFSVLLTNRISSSTYKYTKSILSKAKQEYLKPR
jgi:hypothetical protein